MWWQHYGLALLAGTGFLIIVGILLAYLIHSRRMIDHLKTMLEQHGDALQDQEHTIVKLQQANRELQQTTSLLLHADTHMRSLLSQRIHDQPEQQALRIRSLLGHWQHKLRIEAERDPKGKVIVQPLIEALGKVRKISEELEDDLHGLQLLVEDVYQRRSLGLKQHLEKLICEDIPSLHPESPLKTQADLRAIDTLGHALEQTAEGEKIAETLSFIVTQALLNTYNHAGATFATVRTARKNGMLEVQITDDGRGFEVKEAILARGNLLKMRLKLREIGGTFGINSILRPQNGHGTTITLRIPSTSLDRYIT